MIGNFYFTVLDPNANPNKRQRQPALLGDHPPDYGKYPIKKKKGLTFRRVDHIPILYLYLGCFFHLIKVALKEVIIATMTTATALLLPTAWGQVWGGVVEVPSAMALDTGHHPLNMVLTLTPRFLWYMALSPRRSMLTKSSTFSASTAM